MIANLSEDQRRAIEEHGGMPVYVVDADTNTNYVLMRAEHFETLRSLFSEEEFDPRQAYPFVDRIMAEDDANDPALESYQNLQKQPS
jgi:hypothetical protein